MGGACGAYGRVERRIRGMRERDHLGDPGVDEG
jgi:hypothetical protein